MLSNGLGIIPGQIEKQGWRGKMIETGTRLRMSDVVDCLRWVKNHHCAFHRPERRKSTVSVCFFSFVKLTADYRMKSSDIPCLGSGILHYFFLFTCNSLAAGFEKTNCTVQIKLVDLSLPEKSRAAADRTLGQPSSPDRSAFCYCKSLIMTSLRCLHV